MTRGYPTRSTSAAIARAVVLAVVFAGPLPARAQAGAPAAASAPAGSRMLATVRALTAPGMDGRASGTPGNAQARAWIETRFAALGARPLTGDSYAQAFTFTTAAGLTMHGVNLVASCPGTRVGAPAIVVSAHYDHLGIRNGQTYHGADDNASGVAVLLAVAERCVAAPWAHPLLLVALDAEELGLQGAKAFLAHPPVPIARLALNVNLDMVGRNDRREIFVAGPGRWPRLRPVLTAATRGAPITVKFGHDTGGGHEDWTHQSDHGVFHSAGIPFVYFGVEDHADYHQPTDTPDKISPEFLEGVATVVLSSLTALDRAPAYK